MAEVRLSRSCKLWTWPSREAVAAVGVSGEDRAPGIHAEGVLAQGPWADAQNRDRAPTCRRKSESGGPARVLRKERRRILPERCSELCWGKTRSGPHGPSAGTWKLAQGVPGRLGK